MSRRSREKFAGLPSRRDPSGRQLGPFLRPDRRLVSSRLPGGFALEEFAQHIHALAQTIILLDFLDAPLGFVSRHQLADLLQGEILKLAHALARDLEFSANLLEGELVVAVKAEPHPQNVGFA